MRCFIGCALVLGVLVAGCTREVTVKNVNEVIHVCKTNVKTVRDEFGSPQKVGMMNDLVTNDYNNEASGHRMIVVYKNDIVVNVVVNPTGLVQLGNRCTRSRKQSGRQAANR